MIARAGRISLGARCVLTAAVLATLVLLPACRCDGGIGRRHMGESMDWTFEQFSRHNRESNAAFAEHLSNIPDFLLPDFDGSVREISRTVNLYTDGVAEPCWCPEAR